MSSTVTSRSDVADPAEALRTDDAADPDEAESIDEVGDTAVRLSGVKMA